MDEALFILIIVGSIVISVLAGTYFLVLKPWQELVHKTIDDTTKRFHDERGKVEIMSCKELKNGLLHDTIQFSDNIQRASERYIGLCE